jgi:hypothetical protein
MFHSEAYRDHSDFNPLAPLDFTVVGTVQVLD